LSNNYHYYYHHQQHHEYYDLIIKQDEEDPDAAEIYVNVEVAGLHQYQFLLDTGAARTSIVFDQYTASLTPSGKNNSRGVSGTSASEDLIILPSIKFGPISKQNFNVVRMAQQNTLSRNLLGMDILKDYCQHFLFDQNRVLVRVVDPEMTGDEDDSNSSDDDNNDNNPPDFQELIFDKGFHPYVEVDFGAGAAAAPAAAGTTTTTATSAAGDAGTGTDAGVGTGKGKGKGNAVWDSGAGITVVDLNFVWKYPAFFEEAGYSFGTDSTGTQVKSPMFIMSTSVIGKTVFPPHKVAAVDLSEVNAHIEIPMDLILGYSTLKQADWLFDFPHRRWAIIKRHGHD
jgi:hypothetical protein